MLLHAVKVYYSCAEFYGGIMRTILAIISLVLAIVTAATVQSQTALKSAPVFIHWGTLIEGKSEQPRKNVFFEIDGDKIAEITSASLRTSKVLEYTTELC